MKSQDSLFFRHAESFLLSHCPQFKRHVVLAVSGGVDSMLLLAWASWLKKKGQLKSLRVFTVNHQTRTGQSEDTQLVRRCAKELGLEIKVLNRNTSPPMSNIEATLRNDRYVLLTNELAHHEALWTAHHLDDSWEWSQLQMARSSEPQSALGIPLKNGKVLRPFLCVTKKQIILEAQRRNLTWREDPTNRLDVYARALFRHQLAPLIAAQHPQYLKHYARRSQRLAESLGLSLKTSQTCFEKVTSKSILLWGPVDELKLIAAVKKMSGASRGSLNREIPKILKAIKNNKRGPFTLSGGVRVYLYGEMIWVTQKNYHSMDLLPEKMEFKSWSKTALRNELNLLIASGKLEHFPFWVALKPDSKAQRLFTGTGFDSLWPKLTSQRAIRLISAEKLLKRWNKQDDSYHLCPLWS